LRIVVLICLALSSSDRGDGLLIVVGRRSSPPLDNHGYEMRYHMRDPGAFIEVG
jgi:hypothetical protein